MRGLEKRLNCVSFDHRKKYQWTQVQLDLFEAGSKDWNLGSHHGVMDRKARNHNGMLVEDAIVQRFRLIEMR